MPTKKKLQSDQDTKVFEFGVREIQDLGFSIPIEPVMPANVHIGYGLSYSFKGEENTMAITVSVRFASITNGEENEFLTTHVKTRFFIKDMAQYFKNDSYVFPGSTMESMFGIALSHTRAVLAKNIAGTEYSSYIIPLADPVALYQNIMKANEESK
ncbi:hypothetical protein FHW88_000278 [Mucilaginibacter sp. SG538B]|uniref:hypothetical protein n=1 Tax=Mucilaginibacter sp. SG538B TaxID=2587021 RepID=UPI00159D1FC8|nr:hypothetical protein [Mucilaginibacter sp. SG538B]NVM62002.1 hypothetical protein [Mucilaginibacter sp. SG538B]